MWIFSQHGFFSVVCAYKDGGKSGDPDPDTLMIRARLRRHLEALQQRFAAIALYAIAESPNNDYRFRIVAPKAVVAPIVGEMAVEITYGNFKDKCHRVWPAGLDAGYVSSLHRVWSVMHGLQAGVTVPPPPPRFNPFMGMFARLPREGDDEPASDDVGVDERMVDAQMDDDLALRGVIPSDWVLLVSVPKEKGRGWRPACVVLWPDDFVSNREAYAEAVQAGKVEQVDDEHRLKFTRMPWSALRDKGHPVYDYHTDPIGHGPDEDLKV